MISPLKNGDVPKLCQRLPEAKHISGAINPQSIRWYQIFAALSQPINRGIFNSLHGRIVISIHIPQNPILGITYWFSGNSKLAPTVVPSRSSQVRLLKNHLKSPWFPPVKCPQISPLSHSITPFLRIVAMVNPHGKFHSYHHSLCNLRGYIFMVNPPVFSSYPMKSH